MALVTLLVVSERKVRTKAGFLAAESQLKIFHSQILHNTFRSQFDLIGFSHSGTPDRDSLCVSSSLLLALLQNAPRGAYA